MLFFRCTHVTKKVVHVEKLAVHAASIEELATPFAELIQSIDAVINEYENQKIRI